MKHRIVTMAMCFACACALLAVLSCTDPARSGAPPWTFSGTARFTFTGTAPEVKLAAFLHHGGSVVSSPCSNVVSLGSNANSPVNFSVTVDPSSQGATAGDTIIFEMWVDANVNGALDLGENDVFAEPFSPPDPVFGTSSFCMLFSVQKWMIMTSDTGGYAPVDSATKAGANITAALY